MDHLAHRHLALADGGRRQDLSFQVAESADGCFDVGSLVGLWRRRWRPQQGGAVRQPVAVAPAGTLHDRRPRCGLREQGGGGDVDSRLEHLGGHDDPPRPRGIEGCQRVLGTAGPIGGTEPRVQQHHLGRRRPHQRLAQVLGSLDGVEHGQGQSPWPVPGHQLAGHGGGVALGVHIHPQPANPLGAVHPALERAAAVILVDLQDTTDRGVVDGLQRRSVDRRRHPHRSARDSGAQPAPEALELEGGGERGAHELHLVEDPLATGVQEAEVDGPREAALHVTPVEGPRQEHVERADEDGVALGVVPPAALDPPLAAHDHVQADVSLQAKGPEPAPHERGGLLDQDPHRQDVHEPPGRRRSDHRLGMEPPPVQPGEGRGKGFAGARRRPEQLRETVFGQPALVRVRLMPSRSKDEVVEGAARLHGQSSALDSRRRSAIWVRQQGRAERSALTDGDEGLEASPM